MTTLPPIEQPLNLLTDKFFRDLDEADRRIAKLNNRSIGVKTDLGQLHEMNRVIDSKLAHIDVLHKRLSTPFKPLYDGGGLSAGINQVREFKREIDDLHQSVMKSGAISATLTHKVYINNQSFADSIRTGNKDTKDGLKEIRVAIESQRQGIFGMGLSAIFKGFFGGVGASGGLRFGSGVQATLGLDFSQLGKNTGGDLNKKLGQLNEFLDFVAKDVLNVPGGTKQAAQKIKRKVDTLYENILDPQIYSEIEDVIVRGVIARDTIGKKKSTLNAQQLRIREMFDEASRVLFSRFKQEIDEGIADVVSATFKTASVPIRIRKRIINNQSAEKVENQINLFRPEFSTGQTAKSIEKSEGILFMVGGTDPKPSKPGAPKVDTAHWNSQAMQAFLPNAHVETITPYHTVSVEEMTSGIYQKIIREGLLPLLKENKDNLSGFFDEKDINNLIANLSEFHPFEALFSQNLDKGYSKDALRLATKAIAAGLAHPDKPIGIGSVSGGGAIAEEAINIINELARINPEYASIARRVKGFGTGMPMAGLTTPARPDDLAKFMSFVGTLDQVGKGFFGPAFYKDEPRSQLTEELDKEISLPSGIIHPTSPQMKTISGWGEKHDVPKMLNDLVNPLSEFSILLNDFHSGLGKLTDKEAKQIKQLVSILKANITPTGIGDYVESLKNVLAGIKEINKVAGYEAVKTNDIENLVKSLAVNAKAGKTLEDININPKTLNQSIVEMIEQGFGGNVFGFNRVGTDKQAKVLMASGKKSSMQVQALFNTLSEIILGKGIFPDSGFNAVDERIASKSKIKEQLNMSAADLSLRPGDTEGLIQLWLKQSPGVVPIRPMTHGGISEESRKQLQKTWTELLELLKTVDKANKTNYYEQVAGGKEKGLAEFLWDSSQIAILYHQPTLGEMKAQYQKNTPKDKATEQALLKFFELFEKEADIYKKEFLEPVLAIKESEGEGKEDALISFFEKSPFSKMNTFFSDMRGLTKGAKKGSLGRNIDLDKFNDFLNKIQKALIEYELNDRQDSSQIKSVLNEFSGISPLIDVLIEQASGTTRGRIPDSISVDEIEKQRAEIEKEKTKLRNVNRLLIERLRGTSTFKKVDDIQSSFNPLSTNAPVSIPSISFPEGYKETVSTPAQAVEVAWASQINADSKDTTLSQLLTEVKQLLTEVKGFRSDVRGYFGGGGGNYSSPDDKGGGGDSDYIPQPITIGGPPPDDMATGVSRGGPMSPFGGAGGIALAGAEQGIRSLDQAVGAISKIVNMIPGNKATKLAATAVLGKAALHQMGIDAPIEHFVQSVLGSIGDTAVDAVTQWVQSHGNMAGADITTSLHKLIQDTLPVQDIPEATNALEKLANFFKGARNVVNSGAQIPLNAIADNLGSLVNNTSATMSDVLDAITRPVVHQVASGVGDVINAGTDVVAGGVVAGAGGQIYNNVAGGVQGTRANERNVTFESKMEAINQLYKKLFIAKDQRPYFNQLVGNASEASIVNYVDQTRHEFEQFKAIYDDLIKSSQLTKEQASSLNSKKRWVETSLKKIQEIISKVAEGTELTPAEYDLLGKTQGTGLKFEDYLQNPNPTNLSGTGITMRDHFGEIVSGLPQRMSVDDRRELRGLVINDASQAKLFNNLIDVAAFSISADKDVEKVAKDAITKLFTALARTAKEQGSLEGIGSNIINSLLAELIRSGGKITLAIKEIAKDLPDTFKDVLGIKSPSKVFESIGKDIVAGLDRGLDFKGTLEERQTLLEGYVKSFIDLVYQFDPPSSDKKLKDLSSIEKIRSLFDRVSNNEKINTKNISGYLPKLKVDSEGITAYEPSKNRVSIGKGALKDATELINSFTHELTHAIQYDFGKIQNSSLYARSLGRDGASFSGHDYVYKGASLSTSDYRDDFLDPVLNFKDKWSKMPFVGNILARLQGLGDISHVSKKTYQSLLSAQFSLEKEAYANGFAAAVKYKEAGKQLNDPPQKLAISSTLDSSLAADIAALKALKAKLKKESEQAGKSIGEGAGIGVGESAILPVKETEQMFKDTITTAKRVLDSNSPSKEFIKIGQDVVLGYEIGVNGKIKNLRLEKLPAPNYFDKKDIEKQVAKEIGYVERDWFDYDKKASEITNKEFGKEWGDLPSAKYEHEWMWIEAKVAARNKIISELESADLPKKELFDKLVNERIAAFSDPAKVLGADYKEYQDPHLSTQLESIYSHPLIKESIDYDIGENIKSLFLDNAKLAVEPKFLERTDITLDKELLELEREVNKTTSAFKHLIKEFVSYGYSGFISYQINPDKSITNIQDVYSGDLKKLDDYQILEKYGTKNINLDYIQSLKEFKNDNWAEASKAKDFLPAIAQYRDIRPDYQPDLKAVFAKADLEDLHSSVRKLDDTVGEINPETAKKMSSDDFAFSDFQAIMENRQREMDAEYAKLAEKNRLHFLGISEAQSLGKSAADVYNSSGIKGILDFLKKPLGGDAPNFSAGLAPDQLDPYYGYSKQEYRQANKLKETAGLYAIKYHLDSLAGADKAKAIATLPVDVLLKIRGLDKSRNSAAMEVGMYVSQGFREGVDKYAHLAEESGNKLAKGSITSTRKALDSNSPSRVFIQIGRDVVLGYEIGLKGEIERISRLTLPIPELEKQGWKNIDSLKGGVLGEVDVLRLKDLARVDSKMPLDMAVLAHNATVKDVWAKVTKANRWQLPTSIIDTNIPTFSPKTLSSPPWAVAPAETIPDPWETVPTPQSQSSAIVPYDKGLARRQKIWTANKVQKIKEKGEQERAAINAEFEKELAKTKALLDDIEASMGGSGGGGSVPPVASAGASPDQPNRKKGVTLDDLSPRKGKPFMSGANQFVGDRANDMVEAINKAPQNADKGFWTWFNTVLDEIEEGAATVGTGLRGLGNIIGALEEKMPGVKRIVDNLKGFAGGILLYLGVQQFEQIIVDFGRAGVTTALQLERIKVALTYDPSVNAASKLKDIARFADDVGANALVAAENYSKLAVAAANTPVAPQSEAIFRGFTGALVAQGADPEEQRRAILSIQQMIGKGEILAEELRAQLAEVMPQAIGAMARSKGLTQEQLTNEMKDSKLFPQTDLLPLARQLEFESTVSMAGVRQGPLGSISRFQNAQQRLQAGFGQTLLGVGAPLMDNVATPALDLLGKTATITTSAIAALAGMLTVKFIAALISTGTGTRVLTIALKALGLETLTNNFLLSAWNNNLGMLNKNLYISSAASAGLGSSISRNILGLTSGILTATAALAPWILGFAAVGVAVDLVAKRWSAHNSELRKSINLQKEMIDNLIKIGKITPDKDADDVIKPGDSVKMFDFRRGAENLWGLTDVFQNYTDKDGNIKKTVRMRADKADELADIAKGIDESIVYGDMLFDAARGTFASPTRLAKGKKEITEADREIAQINTELEINRYRSDSVRFKELQAKLAAAVGKRQDAVEDNFGDQVLLEQQVKQWEAEKEWNKVNQPDERKRIDVNKKLEERIDAANVILKAIQHHTGETNQNIPRLIGQLKLLDFAASNMAEANTLSAGARSNATLQARLTGPLNDVELQARQLRGAIFTTQKEIEANNFVMTGSKAILSQVPDSIGQDALNRPELRDFYLNVRKSPMEAIMNTSVETMQKLISDGGNITPALKLWIEAAIRYKQSVLKAGELTNKLLQAELERQKFEEQRLILLLETNQAIAANNKNMAVSRKLLSGAIGLTQQSYELAGVNLENARDALETLMARATFKSTDPVTFSRDVSNAQKAIADAEVAFMQATYALDDYFRQTYASIRDFTWSVEDNNRNTARNIRSLEESWADLLFDLNNQLLTAQNELKTTNDKIARTDRRIGIAGISANPESAAKRSLTLINDYFASLDDSAAQGRSLEQQQKQIGQEYVTTLRRIREEQEKQLDAERERTRTIVRMEEQYRNLLIGIQRNVTGFLNQLSEWASKVKLPQVYLLPPTSPAGANVAPAIINNSAPAQKTLPPPPKTKASNPFEHLPMGQEETMALNFGIPEGLAGDRAIVAGNLLMKGINFLQSYRKEWKLENWVKEYKSRLKKGQTFNYRMLETWLKIESKNTGNVNPSVLKELEQINRDTAQREADFRRRYVEGAMKLEREKNKQPHPFTNKPTPKINPQPINPKRAQQPTKPVQTKIIEDHRTAIGKVEREVKQLESVYGKDFELIAVTMDQRLVLANRYLKELVKRYGISTASISATNAKLLAEYRFDSAKFAIGGLKGDIQGSFEQYVEQEVLAGRLPKPQPKAKASAPATKPQQPKPPAQTTKLLAPATRKQQQPPAPAIAPPGNIVIPPINYGAAGNTTDNIRDVKTENIQQQQVLRQKNDELQLLNLINELKMLERGYQDQIRGLKRTAFDNDNKLIDLRAGAKGYKTADEEISAAGRSVQMSFIGDLRTYEDRFIELDRLIKDYNSQEAQDARAKALQEADQKGGKIGEQIRERLKLEAEVIETLKQQQGYIANQYTETYKLLAPTKAITKQRKAQELSLAAQNAYVDVQAKLFDAQYNINGMTLTNPAKVLQARMAAFRANDDLRKQLEGMTGLLSPEQMDRMRQMQKEVNDLNIKGAFVDSIPFLKEFSSNMRDAILQTTTLDEAFRKLGNLALGTILDQLTIKPLQNLIAEQIGPLLGFNDADKQVPVVNNIVPFSSSDAYQLANDNLLSFTANLSDANNNAIAPFTDGLLNTSSNTLPSLAGAYTTQMVGIDGFTIAINQATAAVLSFAGAMGGKSSLSFAGSNILGLGSAGVFSSLFNADDAAAGQSITEALTGGFTGIMGGVLNFAEGGPVADAMRRERAESGGRQPVLAVLNTDEYVIPAWEARQYETFKELSQKEVKNFANGGWAATNHAPKISSNNTSKASVSSTQNITINLADTNQLGESMRQLENRRQLELDRLNV